MTVKKTRMQTTLVVDNLSPFTPDIVACLNKLGANYIQKSFSSLTNVTINSNHDNNELQLQILWAQSRRQRLINNKSKGLGDGANYGKEQ